MTTRSNVRSRTIDPWCATSSTRRVSRWTTTELRTSRLVLHPLDVAEAARVVARTPAPTERWSEGFPSAGDLRALESFLDATERAGDQGPFGFYQITRLADDAVIGGIGFKGPPEAGQVEIGYGLVPSAQGHGYASEAVVALLALAGNLGVRVVVADTTSENVASQKTLLNAGFRRTGADLATCHFAVVLDEDGSRD